MNSTGVLRLRKVARIIAWACLVLIAVLTVSPVSWRPDFGHVNIERFAAFAVAGVLFGIAYPCRILVVALILVGSAALLELMQFVIPTRDASLSNFVLKAAGGLIGLGAAAAANQLVDRRWR